jgi:TolB-like protein/DNA-binding winged helix-turn-helix (wHTH) protein
LSNLSSSDQRTGLLKIGDFLIDPAATSISGPSGVVHIEPKIMEVLVALCDNAGEVVTRDALIEKIWRVEYGGDESLTRAISILRKAFHDDRGVRRLIETIPKRGYRLTAPVAPAEGADMKSGDRQGEAIGVRNIDTGRRWWSQLNRASKPAVYASLIVILLIFGVVLFLGSPALSPQPKNSVAVLPFVALSSGEDDGYFADGLTEEVLNSLAALPELNVTARMSSFYYKDKQASLDEIAETLSVAYIVEGSIRRAEDDVRVTAKLIRTIDGIQLWSQSYDRPIQNVLEIQVDIAEKIAEALDVVIDGEKRAAMKNAGLQNVDAFIAFQKAAVLQARAHGDLPQIPTLIEANKLYDSATNKAPGFWPALFVKTDLYTHILLNAAAGESQPNLSAEYIDRADDELARILAAAYDGARDDKERAYVGVVKTLFSNNWTDAVSYLDRAFKLANCGRYEQWTQVLSVPYGQARQARQLYQKNMKCDPIAHIAWVNAAMASLYLGEAAQALSIIDAAKEKVGFTPLLERTRFEALLAAGRFDDANQTLQNLSGKVRMIEQVGLHAALGEGGAAKQLAEALYQQSSEISSSELAAPLGNRDDALILSIAPLLGERDVANAAAARIDARPFGSARLALAVYECLCGAPFDLEAAPNFAARVDEAGFAWPPVSPINYPLKDW